MTGFILCISSLQARQWTAMSILGNQPALADWNPEGMKMQVLNDTTRVIDLNLRLPAEFKFTKGSWDYQYFIKNGDPGNQRISSPEKAIKHYKTH